MAVGYDHAILPLASMRDRRTEIRWGLRDFELRFGRSADGFWLPETAVDVPTLRMLAEEGVRYTILAPWQAADASLETRRPYRVELGGGHSLVVVFYDADLSAAVSFEPAATGDADRFASERVAPRIVDGAPPGELSSLAVIATDGELYGHHQKFRDLFLARLVGTIAPAATTAGPSEPAFDVVSLDQALRESPRHSFPATRITERTSWSCHHGVLRWSGECPDTVDGRWKAPLRAALDRLAAGVDATSEALLRGVSVAPPSFWTARDAYVDVLFGAEPPAAFGARLLGTRVAASRRRLLLELLEAQRWRLAMFGSDGWFWDDPIRDETKQLMRCAARAARIVDELAGSTLERVLADDLAVLVSPSRGVDGLAIYREALAEVGQPAP